jgi:hypothetical protein
MISYYILDNPANFLEVDNFEPPGEVIAELSPACFEGIVS